MNMAGQCQDPQNSLMPFRSAGRCGIACWNFRSGRKQFVEDGGMQTLTTSVTTSALVVTVLLAVPALAGEDNVGASRHDNLVAISMPYVLSNIEMDSVTAFPISPGSLGQLGATFDAAYVARQALELATDGELTRLGGIIGGDICDAVKCNDPERGLINEVGKKPGESFDPPSAPKHVPLRKELAVAFLSASLVLVNHPQLRKHFASLIEDISLPPRADRLEEIAPAYLATIALMEAKPHLSNRLTELFKGRSLRSKNSRQVKETLTVLARTERHNQTGASILELHPGLERRLTNRLRELSRGKAPKHLNRLFR
jgi:hypothetical protein